MTKRVRALLAGAAIVSAGLFAASQASALIIVKAVYNAGNPGGDFTPSDPFGTILNTSLYETVTAGQPGNVCTDAGNCTYDFTFTLSGLAPGATTQIQIQAASQIQPNTAEPLDYDLFMGVPTGTNALPITDGSFLKASAPSGGLAQIINDALGDGTYFVQVAPAQVVSDGEIASGSLTQIQPTVPEPATWALMLVGFGGVGAALRRRARTASVAA